MRAISARAVLLGTAAATALFACPAVAAPAPPPAPPVSQDAAAVQSSNNAQTQTQAATGSDQAITVTARRRNEVLLNVPVSVTAFTGEQLNRQGALDIADLAKTTPDVTFKASRGTNSTLTAFIRGVGQQDPVAGFEQGVGLYLDDVYLNRPQASLLDIYDVERIEVLRGPQGTLYGRNTIGGAIKYVTRRIRTDGTHISLRTNIGTHQQADFIASISTPITRQLLVSVAGARLSNGGFGKNLTTGLSNYNKDVLAARGTVELVPSDSVFIRLTGDYTWDNSNTRGGHRLIPNQCTLATTAFACNGAFPVLTNVFDSQGSLSDPLQRVRSGGVALSGEAELADGLKFRSITAYRKDNTHTPIDFDALPYADVDVPAVYRNHQFSQEFQLVVDKGRLQGVAGLYYLNARAFDVFDVRLYTTSPAALPGLTATTRGNVGTRTWAAFADFTYDFTPQWSVSLGGRWTNDQRHAVVTRANLLFGGAPELGGSNGFGVGTQLGALTSSFDGKRTDTAFTPRASVSFKPDKNNNLYLSYSRGFKGGGFDPRGLTTSTPRTDPLVPPTTQQIYDFMAFDPETVDSYEAGWKASLFDRRLQFALAVFDAEYKNVQVPGSAGGFSSTGVPTFIGITTNAGKARFRGVELEGNWRMAENIGTSGDRLNFAGSLGYLDAKYLHYLTVLTIGQNGLPTAPTQVDVAPFRKIQNTPKWTLSGTLDYDTPLGGGHLDLNTTLSYRSSSQQFELASPGLDQPAFTLWDANLIWRSAGNRYEFGIHGKNLTDKKYIIGGYNFLRQNPFTGQYILASGAPGYAPTLGRTGVLTAYYGNPRQVFLSAAVNF